MRNLFIISAVILLTLVSCEATEVTDETGIETQGIDKDKIETFSDRGDD